MQVRHFVNADVQKIWLSAVISTLPRAEGKEVFTVAFPKAKNRVQAFSPINHVPIVRLSHLSLT